MYGFSGNARPWPRVVPQMIERLSPLYHAFLKGSEQDADIQTLMALVDGDQPMPVTFFAAINMLLLRDQHHPLAKFYPYLTLAPAKAQEAYPDFRHFVLTHAEELRRLLPHFRLQTNEVTRCAQMLPAFELVSRRGGGKPLHLIEIGASAGLNLFWDKYCYQYIDANESREVGNPSSPVLIACRCQNLSLFPLPQTMPEVRERIGIDLSPLDINNGRDVRCLRGAIWPEETSRYALLDSSLPFVRQQPSPRMLKGDASVLLPEVLASLPQEATICLYHSYALRQGPTQVRERIEQICASASRAQPISRVSLEMEPGEWEEPRLELFTYCDGEEACSEWLATASVHGETMHWL